MERTGCGVVKGAGMQNSQANREADTHTPAGFGKRSRERDSRDERERERENIIEKCTAKEEEKEKQKEIERDCEGHGAEGGFKCMALHAFAHVSWLLLSCDMMRLLW